MKLKEFRIFKGEMECLTGLMIGAGKEDLDIGGIDLTVIRQPITGEPYVPGSSLKGRMRNLLEKREDRTSNNGNEPCNCGAPGCLICTVFGAHKNSHSAVAPTRLIVRDAGLSEASRVKYREVLEEKGLSSMEVKVENIINRKTGVAEHPRTFERVPSGTRFEVEMVLQVYEGDDVAGMEKIVRDCLAMVENTYLGGQGSRGYGKVKFHLPQDPEIRPA